MKNMKKLLQKAMVFTLTAAMLVGTPMTASAAGLVDLYSISDGTDKDGNESGTGTVTNTNTDSHSGVLKENDASIMNIVLDKDYVNAEKGVKETLKATIVFDGDLKDGLKDYPDVVKEIESNIKWQVLNAEGKIDANTNKVLSISASAADRTVVTLNPRQGTVKGEEMIVRATIDGSYWWEKVGDEIQKHELKDGKTYTAEAKVSIKEYTTGLAFDNPMPHAYLKQTLDLNKYITRTPETANDEITWISTNPKVAAVTAAGVVTFKKVDKCQIIAVSERGVKDTWDVVVEAGEQSSKIEIIDDVGNPFPGKKANADLKDGDWIKNVDVNMYKTMKVAVGEDGKTAATNLEEAAAGMKKDKYTVKNVAVKNGDRYVTVTKVDGKEVATLSEEPLDITDTVTWTSNKPAIVSVEAQPGETGAELTAKGVGTAVITAKASSGKTDKLTVTVKATLEKLEITNKEEKLYSGQSLQMTFDRTPEENKDAVKWSIAKVKYLDGKGNVKEKANPNATINGKGVLTIKPKLDPNYDKVEVVLESKTKPIKSDETDRKGNPIMVPAKDTWEVEIEQSSIDAITVKDDDNIQIARVETTYNTSGVGKVSQVNMGAANTTKISVPKDRTYEATVEAGKDGYAGGEDTLTWTTSNAKVASIEYKGGTAKITANASGTATITVSGIRAVNQTKNEVTSLKSASVIKTTFKVSVKQPVKTVTLNKPSVVLNEKTKKVNKKDTLQDQKVALKATLGPKGVGKAETVKWTVKQNGETLTNKEALGLEKKGKEVTSASVSVNLPTPEVGDVFEITATAESGASATSVVKVVEKTVGVAIAEKLDNGTPVPFTAPSGKKTVNNAKVIDLGKNFKMNTYVNIGTTGKNGIAKWVVSGDDNSEDVTYTVNKKGIVTIGSDGTVYGIKAGKVTITAKTPLGKKATLTVTVN